MTFLSTIATSSYRLTQVELVSSIFTVSSHFFIAERKSFYLNRLGAINVYHFLHTLLQYLFHQSISTLRDLREIQFYDLERIENISNASISSSGRLKWILFSRTIIVESILQRFEILQSRMFSSIEEQSRGETKQIKSGRRREKEFLGVNEKFEIVRARFCVEMFILFFSFRAKTLRWLSKQLTTNEKKTRILSATKNWKVKKAFLTTITIKYLLKIPEKWSTRDIAKEFPDPGRFLATARPLFVASFPLKRNKSNYFLVSTRFHPLTLQQSFTLALCVPLLMAVKLLDV